MEKEYDVIVAGTGIGGATVAREMAGKGKRVLMLERGGRFNMMGNTVTMAMILQNFGLIRSKEKYTVTFGNNYGGLSVLAAGCAVAPPESIFSPFGIDLAAETKEAGKDMKVQIMPDYLIGQANLRLMEAANAAGYNWSRLENFIDPAKCVEGCADCMLGCPEGRQVFSQELWRRGCPKRRRPEALRNGYGCNRG